MWKAKLPYGVEFEIATTRVERPHLLEGDADGELAGVGRWRLFEHGGVTAVVYEWNVRTTRWWMNLLAPVAKPVFEANHDYVMRNGGEGSRSCWACGCWRSTSGSPPRLALFISLALTMRVPIPTSQHDREVRNGGTQMKLKPLGDRLIVQASEEDEVTASGIVLPDTAKESPRRARSWPSATVR